MELIVVSDTRLKVVLSPEDMALFRLAPETMEEGDEENREAFAHLFREIRRISGFDATEARVLVQVWRDSRGGCELYITILSSQKGGAGKGEREMRRLRCLYSFDSFDRLTAACRVLLSRAYHAPSDAYRGEDGRWYLVLEEDGDGADIGPLSVLNEYGSRHPITVLTLLSEHGKLVSRGEAVTRLAGLV